jgi:hypothetical protein
MTYTQDQCNTKGKRTLILHKNSTNCDSSREESKNADAIHYQMSAIAQQNSTKPHQQHLKTRKHSTV